MKIGDKLKELREYYGYSQNELSKFLDVPQRTISNYEAQEDPGGMLDYIYKICGKFNIPVYEFFRSDSGHKGSSTVNDNLSEYVTPEQAKLLKILNTGVDINTRLQITKLFVEVAKSILMQQKDKLKHLPEFKELMGDLLEDEPSSKKKK